jgi:lipoprotein signal peptidase
MNDSDDIMSTNGGCAASVPADPTMEARSAIGDVWSHLRLWPIAVIGLAADLWTKHWAFTRLGPDEGWVVIPYVMSFRRSLNSGALFGMGKGLTPLFIVASVLALGFVLYLFAHSTRNRRTLHIALALVLGGALGNLYDRAFMVADVVKYTLKGQTVTSVGLIMEETASHILLAPWPEGETDRPIRVSKALNPEKRQQGVVRDFIKMEPKIGSFEWWPWVFNIADSLLVVGVGLLMLNFWWDRKAEQAQRAASETASSGSG